MDSGFSAFNLGGFLLVHQVTILGGVESALESNWSVKAEYLYFDLDCIFRLMTDPVFAPVYNASADLKGSIVRAGLNYHF